MTNDLENIIYSEETIKRRVAELGAQISADYRDKNPIMLGVLKGSFIFLSDLVRSMDTACEVRFLGASSYGLGAESSGAVNITRMLDFDVCGRDVIIVEDILDTGITLRSLSDFLTELNPASLRVCALLDKTVRRVTPIKAHYIGFDCPDGFVVGYGLDYAERYRNLPYIATLKPDVYSCCAVSP